MKTLKIEVVVVNEQSAPIVKISRSKDLKDIDLMVMAGAIVGVVYASIKTKTYFEKKRLKVKILKIIQRHITSVDRGGLTDYGNRKDNEQ